MLNSARCVPSLTTVQRVSQTLQLYKELISHFFYFNRTNFAQNKFFAMREKSIWKISTLTWLYISIINSGRTKCVHSVFMWHSQLICHKYKQKIFPWPLPCQCKVFLKPHAYVSHTGIVCTGKIAEFHLIKLTTIGVITQATTHTHTTIHIFVVRASVCMLCVSNVKWTHTWANLNAIYEITSKEWSFALLANEYALNNLNFSVLAKNQGLCLIYFHLNVHDHQHNTISEEFLFNRV